MVSQNGPRSGGYSLLFCSLLGLALGSGCADVRRYQTPELFHPRTAAGRSQLEQTLHGPVVIAGPTSSLKPGTNGNYKITIYDSSTASDASQTTVDVFPSEAGSFQTNAQGGVITIDRTKLNGLDQVEVWAKGRAAASLPPGQAMQKNLFARSLFPVETPPDETEDEEDRDQESNLVKIPTTVLNRNMAKPFVLVTYHGPNTNGTPLTSLLAVRTDPGGFITNMIATNNELRVELDAKVFEESHLTVEVEVESPAFQSKSAREKKKLGSLVQSDISIAQGSLFPIGFQVASPEDTAQEFGQTFADCFYACEIQISNPNDKPLLVYSASLRVGVRYLLASNDVVKLFGRGALEHPELLPLLRDENGRLQDYLDYKEDRRPMSYSDILAIFEYQKQGNPRQQLIDNMKSAGEIATAAGIFIAGPAYPKAVGLFTGVFTHEMEKRLLWDLLMHAKNLQARSFQEIEEISPNGGLHKLVFFPRRPIYGILPKVPLYIAEFKPGETEVYATGTVITKDHTIQTTGQPQPATQP